MAQLGEASANRSTSGALSAEDTVEFPRETFSHRRNFVQKEATSPRKSVSRRFVPARNRNNWNRMRASLQVIHMGAVFTCALPAKGTRSPLIEPTGAATARD